jgi:hypothetical protein
MLLAVAGLRMTVATQTAINSRPAVQPPEEKISLFARSDPTAELPEARPDAGVSTTLMLLLPGAVRGIPNPSRAFASDPPELASE